MVTENSCSKCCTVCVARQTTIFTWHLTLWEVTAHDRMASGKIFGDISCLEDVLLTKCVIFFVSYKCVKSTETFIPVSQEKIFYPSDGFYSSVTALISEENRDFAPFYSTRSCVWSTGRGILFWHYNRSILYDFLQSGNSSKLTPGEKAQSLLLPF